MRYLWLSGMAALALGSSALAHAFLERASPAVGSKIAAAPRQIELTFTEGVEPLFSTIELRDARGSPVATGKPQAEPGDQRKLAVELPALSSGTYTVTWHVTSVDTHKTEGQFQFTVAP